MVRVLDIRPHRRQYTHGLVQKLRNSSALAMELRLIALNHRYHLHGIADSYIRIRLSRIH